uniref:Uncharacterized protein n=1 Tax=Arundo donax TaxID=35708 RepID=A0A0A9BL08_ARUDO
MVVMGLSSLSSNQTIFSRVFLPIVCATGTAFFNLIVGRFTLFFNYLSAPILVQ